MTNQHSTDPDALREMIEARLAEHWKWLIFTGIAVALLHPGFRRSAAIRHTGSASWESRCRC